jgi:UDP-N-acetylmuramate--alanine ligase
LSTDVQNDTLIIITPAIPEDCVILNHFISVGYTPYKRSQVLGIISDDYFCIAVAGTHGKTTTSAIITHLLKDAGLDCSSFLGGISTNYQTNLLLGSSNIIIVEADEYDRSFLTLHPNISVITSMDADHLDIYGDIEHLYESFNLFANQLKANGLLIDRYGLPLQNKGETYSVNNNNASIFASNIVIENGAYIFDYVSKDIKLKRLTLGIQGLHNVENALAAIRVALQLKISEDSIRKALTSFAGVKRRFEYIYRDNSVVYIDDYAHHPEELRACLQSVKQLYPEKKITVIFQPHLYSRTKDFATEFAQELSVADELFLLDIYPARELPIEGVTSDIIFDKITINKKHLCLKIELLQMLEYANIEVLVTVGAGDIDTLVIPIRKMLKSKYGV